jgi:ribosomal-protein-alanine N-acetyltransferase
VLVAGDTIIGGIGLSNIVMGPLRSGSLGYWLDAEFTGRGLVTIAANRLCEYADSELGLHRVDAGTQFENEASQRVLARCGFELYGEAPKFLYAGGAWRDHRLFQRILNDRPV